MTHLQYNMNQHHSIEQVGLFINNLQHFYDNKIMPISQNSSLPEGMVNRFLSASDQRESRGVFKRVAEDSRRLKGRDVS